MDLLKMTFVYVMVVTLGLNVTLVRPLGNLLGQWILNSPVNEVCENIEQKLN